MTRNSAAAGTDAAGFWTYGRNRASGRAWLKSCFDPINCPNLCGGCELVPPVPDSSEIKSIGTIMDCFRLM